MWMWEVYVLWASLSRSSRKDVDFERSGNFFVIILFKKLIMKLLSPNISTYVFGYDALPYFWIFSSNPTNIIEYKDLLKIT